jgi:hypothetical protein
VADGNLGTLDGDRIIMNAYAGKDVLKRAGRLPGSRKPHLMYRQVVTM